MFNKYFNKISNWFYNRSFQKREKLAKRLNLIDVSLYELGKEAGNLTESEIKGIFYAKKVSAIFLEKNTDKMEAYAKVFKSMVSKEISDWESYRKELKKDIEKLLLKRIWVE